MVKLNLNALNNQGILDEIISDNTLNQDNSLENLVAETTTPTKKISFKKLVGKTTNSSGNTEELSINNPKENLETKNEDNDNKKVKISLKKQIPEITTPENNETLNEINKYNFNNSETELLNTTNQFEGKNDTTKETSTSEIEAKVDTIKEINTSENSVQNEKSLLISDGDTSCELITTEEDELFGSYNSSFAKQEIITKTPELKMEEIVEVKEIKKIEEKVTPNNTQILTNNINNNGTDKKQNKLKIIITGLISAFSIGLSALLIFQGGLLKGNIQEIKNIETKQEKVDTGILQNNLDNNTINNQNINNITESEIVKENSLDLVENSNNPSKINKKVENFLIKKYKNK